MTDIRNALITQTMLGVEDHGILTAYLTLSGDGWGCGFGGYALDRYDPVKKMRVGDAYGAQFILGVLRALDNTSWEALKGTAVRAEVEGLGGRVLRIGHLIKNQWFDPRVIASEAP